MSAGAPWSVKGIDPKAREVAKDLARRSGMTLGEWLNRVILEDDVPEEITAEAQFADRAFRAEAPRLRAISPPSPPTVPDLARIASALDRLTARIEASETRTGLAINGVEHSVRQALARIETTEREQNTAAARLEGLIAETQAEVSHNSERLRRFEAEPAGPRSAEAMRMLEARLADDEPEHMVDAVLERLGDRLAMAEARTAAALEDLKGSLAGLDRRVGAVERGGGQGIDQRFEALAHTLTQRVDAVRAEVADALASTTGGAVEARFAALAQQVQVAERRSTQAVEDIGRQVLAMAEAVGRKLTDVDNRSAEAIDQVGTEVARIAGAVELRLARAEQTQAESFEKLSAEFARVSDSLTARPAAVVQPTLEPEAAPEPQPAWAPEPAAAAEMFAAPSLLAPPPEPEPEAALSSLSDLVAALGPPPEPEPEIPTVAFGAELFSRAEPVQDDDVEVIDPPWRRLDLEVPDAEPPEAFAPLADDDLFEAEPPEPTQQLSTREVIDRARAAARAAQEAARQAETIDPTAAKVRAAEVRAQLGARATGRLFQGFNMKPRRAPNSALQTALMVAGGAAFLSVGAAGLTLMQAPGAPQAPQIAAAPPLPENPRAAMVLGPGLVTDSTTATPSGPVFAEVRADIEAGLPGALAKLKALADGGHTQAQIYLAQLYDGGEAGLPRDPVEARRLTTLAAEQGDVKAMHNLGVYLFRGEGGTQDLPGAAKWFRKAAAAGVVESQFNLGLLYQSGSGVARDDSQARYWFRLAAARGDTEARKALDQLKPAPAAPAAARAPAAAPRPAASLNVRQTQLVLARQGYYDGPADGLPSDAYRIALAAYQRDLGQH
jgi:localization factor PodJL